MPFAGFKDWADCISKVKAKSLEAKKRICGSLKAKHEDHMKEIEEIKLEIAQRKKEIIEIKEQLLASKKKWIQGVVKKPGAFTTYCKRLGYKGVTSECINHALKQGGHPAKMAAFAKAMRKIN